MFSFNQYPKRLLLLIIILILAFQYYQINQVKLSCSKEIFARDIRVYLSEQLNSKDYWELYSTNEFPDSKNEHPILLKDKKNAIIRSITFEELKKKLGSFSDLEKLNMIKDRFLFFDSKASLVSDRNEHISFVVGIKFLENDISSSLHHLPKLKIILYDFNNNPFLFEKELLSFLISPQNIQLKSRESFQPIDQSIQANCLIDFSLEWPEQIKQGIKLCEFAKTNAVISCFRSIYQDDSNELEVALNICKNATNNWSVNCFHDVYQYLQYDKRKLVKLCQNANSKYPQECFSALNSEFPEELDNIIDVCSTAKNNANKDCFMAIKNNGPWDEKIDLSLCKTSIKKMALYSK